MPFTAYSSRYNPAELALMKKVFDRLCAERRLAAKDKEQRELLAAEVIRTFQDGNVSEDDLWRALSKRRATGRDP